MNVEGFDSEIRYVLANIVRCNDKLRSSLSAEARMIERQSLVNLESLHEDLLKDRALYKDL